MISNAFYVLYVPFVASSSSWLKNKLRAELNVSRIITLRRH